ncbi:TIGR02300 family protein [Chelatococcus reniformis]|uniref:TIGR02300 family protein n=1 Tax=Chelatococcus reniformis TaxID=1494448 RepID=A0A916XKZ5_9HYPH|nr:TIGR02300 family protein [Chelatococcus reniformis]GGC79585.1 TIGR02300 family protein [Chelatococcus reniformis]
MANPELGTKRVCPTTGRKFYDLNKDPIVSPYTGEAFPRTVFEPQAKAGRPAAVEPDDTAPDTAGAEVVSLDDVEAAEEKAEDADDEADINAGEADDTFLEEEVEGDDDVSDLIDGDIEDDEEI